MNSQTGATKMPILTPKICGISLRGLKIGSVFDPIVGPSEAQFGHIMAGFFCQKNVTCSTHRQTYIYIYLKHPPGPRPQASVSFCYQFHLEIYLAIHYILYIYVRSCAIYIPARREEARPSIRSHVNGGSKRKVPFYERCQLANEYKDRYQIDRCHTVRKCIRYIYIYGRPPPKPTFSTFHLKTPYKTHKFHTWE